MRKGRLNAKVHPVVISVSFIDCLRYATVAEMATHAISQAVSNKLN